MFKTHKDGLRMEPTPERVYAVCKYSAQQRCSRDDLVAALSMFPNVAQNTGDIMAAIHVAEELSLLQTKDGSISFIGSKDILVSYIYFRRYVADRVFKQRETTFFKVTEWYISQNEVVFQYDTWEDKAAAIVRDGIDSINENDFLGWRFWASFLGEGYLHNQILIPNMKVRIQDVLVSKFSETFKLGKIVPAYDFLQWLQIQIPEVSLQPDELVPLGVSSALRTMHELGLITLTAQMDATRVKLYPVEGEAFLDFSHIMVKEEIAHELG